MLKLSAVRKVSRPIDLLHSILDGNSYAGWALRVWRRIPPQPLRLKLSPPANPQKPDTQKPDTQKPDDDQGPTETLKVSVNVVGVFFNVKDKHGALIPNLTKDDFEILEDGKPQTIKYFTAESNLPLTLGMLIDSSGSQLRVLDMEKEVGGAFLKQILSDKDEAYVIDFNVDASLVQDFTRDIHRLQNAMNKVKINTGITSVGIPGGGGGPVANRRIAAGNRAVRRGLSFRARHAGQGSWTKSDDPFDRRRG